MINSQTKIFLILLNSICFIENVYSQNKEIPIPPEILYSKADSLFDLNQWKEGIELLNLILEDSALIPLELRKKSYQFKGYAFYYLGEYDSSNLCYNLAYDLSENDGDTSRMIGILRSIGLNYRNQSLFALSLDQYQKALKLAIAKGDELKAVAEIQNAMGMLYKDLGDYRKALEYPKLSLELAIQNKDSSVISYGFNNAAMAYHNLGKYDSSLFYNFLALEIKNKINEKFSEASTLNNIGMDYLKLKEFDVAEKYFQQAFEQYKDQNSSKGLIIINNNLADLYLAKGEFKKAKPYLFEAYKILQEADIKELLIDNLELQVKYYEGITNFKEALLAEKKLSKIKEEIFQEEKIRTKDVETEYLLEEKENEKLKIMQAMALSKAENKRFYQVTIFLTIITILLLILTIGYLKFSERLKIKNNIIELQKTDIIHRTNNTLAKVQAILKLIANSFTNEAEKEKLRFAESVIISAGKLQEFTYSSVSHRGKVVLDLYLKSLTENIFETFAPKDQQIVYILLLEEGVLIPEEQGMNIGIIYSEIVLNAIKYAFENDQSPKPEISVDLKMKREKLMLKVQDNGKGLPKDLKYGTGLKMIQKLAKQIRAQLNISSGENGTKFTLILNRL